MSTESLVATEIDLMIKRVPVKTTSTVADIAKEVEEYGDDFFSDDVMTEILGKATIYEGFNHKTILSILINRGGGDLKKDMAFLISMFVSRGTSIISQTKRSTIPEKYRNLFNILVKRYSVKQTITGDRAECITLPRISAVFPYLTAKCLENLQPSRPVTIEQFIRVAGGKVPYCATFLGCLTLLRELSSKKNAVTMIIWYQILCSKIINSRNERGESKSELYKKYTEQVINYANAVMTSGKLVTYKKDQLVTIGFTTGENDYDFVSENLKKWCKDNGVSYDSLNAAIDMIVNQY